MPATRFVFSEREQGDFCVDRDPGELARARADLLAGEWTWLRQVHGADVAVVTEPGEHAGAHADAAVTAVPGAVLAVHTADCVPVLLSGDGVVGVAHVGWRGLLAGVLEATIDAMIDLGARRCRAVVGPHIRARCYEFGAADLERVADRYGDAVRATTPAGTPALDLLAGITASIDGRPDHAALARTEPGCTACEPRRFFSHRARGETGRQAAAIRVAP